MDLEYTVTETLTSLGGRVSEINYEFEEITVEAISLGLSTKRERRARAYSARISRDQYAALSRAMSVSLSFDDFVQVLRPFMMGFYRNRELEQAFGILDRDHSGLVHIDELNVFLPIINQYATGDTLKSYVRKVYSNIENNLTYDEFRTLILRGIGRDILCNNI
ncbi:unnamed protein product [Rotaria socialis]|uniref:EF-hand domain-containing protein n=1 Tax=Rotaria socialis TaxID=392032 RepID=A0A821VBE7_9BILA|nr:unnamed protein product [Rotaria socialis]CAF3393132.1 unnamed protein product [Rotaria socialis]CAF3430786.1 unnamed protein product [Rotaria socialis]CAF3436125.1 unnamed protein product [Rotaria socialis]CAF3571967.1 unnamed protein product [Rotaria socialis]